MNDYVPAYAPEGWQPDSVEIRTRLDDNDASISVHAIPGLGRKFAIREVICDGRRIEIVIRTARQLDQLIGDLMAARETLNPIPLSQTNKDEERGREVVERIIAELDQRTLETQITQAVETAIDEAFAAGMEQKKTLIRKGKGKPSL